MKIYDKNTFKNIFIFALAALFMVPTLLWAINTVATGFRIDTTKREIDAHSVCRETYVTSGTNQYFVPTKTAPEWQAFRDFKPSDVTLNLCPSDACIASSATYPAKHDSNSLQTTTNGKWIADSYQCLRPWTIDRFAVDHNDNERLGNQLSMTVNICSWLPSLANGSNFFVTTDVAGGSWVENGGGSRFTTARFKRGTAAQNNQVKNSNNSDNKDHYSWREYDGNCTVTLRSRQGYDGGNRTNFHDQHITLFNIGFDSNFGGESTGYIYNCTSGTCSCESGNCPSSSSSSSSTSSGGSSGGSSGSSSGDIQIQ